MTRAVNICSVAVVEANTIRYSEKVGTATGGDNEGRRQTWKGRGKTFKATSRERERERERESKEGWEK